jgi:hypothetical protein
MTPGPRATASSRAVFAGGFTPALALVTALLASACGGGGDGGAASSPPPTSPPNPPPSTLIQDAPRNCETRADYTLCVTVQDTRTRAETVGHMKEVYFEVYPQLVERFNRAAPRTVDFRIGPSDAIAGAGGTLVVYQTEWLLQHPQDYDVVVHEVMHIVQNYLSSPGWLTEGIADYVRYQYGTNNAAAGWQLQPPGTGSSYTDGYGTTARFLVWVEQRHGIELVNVLDGAIRGGSYVPGLWISYTGKTVDELWSAYLADPSIEPS